MRQRTARLLLIASLLFSMGAHLAIIQTVAWARMAVDYSRNSNLGTSLQKTFDGRHPCPLCLKLRKASSAGPSLGASRTENPLRAAVLSSVPQIRNIVLA